MEDSTQRKRQRSTQKGIKNPTKVNLWWDLAIFVAALFAPAVMFTGLAIHEWLGIGLALAVVVHLLLHWQWIVQTTKRFFAHTTWPARLNYLVNSLFFIALTVIITSGLMISRVALPFLGISLQSSLPWHQLHTLAADTMVFVLAVHVGLHGKWIVSTANRYLVQPVLNLGKRGSKPVSSPVNNPALSKRVIEKEGVA